MYRRFIANTILRPTHHRFVAADGSAIATSQRTISGIAATSDLCKQDGVALVIAGANLDRFTAGLGKLLDEHDPRSLLGVVTDVTKGICLRFDVRLSAPGVSELADEKWRQIQGNDLGAFSIGFTVDAHEPIPGGVRATRWTLHEISLVSLPVDPKCILTAKAPKGTRSMNKSKHAIANVDTALEEHRAASRHHTDMAEAMDRLDTHRRAAGTALRGLHQALESADPTQTGECVTRCKRSLEGMTRELRSIGDRHGDLQDAHQAMCRALREATPAVTEIQTSSGVEDEASSGERSKRLREARQLRQIGHSYE
jgi:phage head maturation protease